MPWDWNRAFGRSLGYAPDWQAKMEEQNYANMLYQFMHPETYPGGMQETANLRGLYGKMVQETGNQVGLADWANAYWNWLQGGASTYTDVPAGEAAPMAENALHYVSGVGYMKEADLKQYDPRGFDAITKQRATEAKDPSVNPYWEKSPTAAHTDWTQNTANRPAWMSNYQNMGQFMATHSGGPPPGMNPGRGAGAGAGVNYSPGTGNRVGNTATTSVPGQTAVTPNQWSGDYQQQARERSAKRMGRDISQAGVTKVPNAKEELSRRTRQMFRKY